MPSFSLFGFVSTAIAVAASLTFFYSLQTEAIKSHSTVNAAFLTATVVLWIPLISKVALRLRLITKPNAPTRDTWVGIVATVLGFAILEGFNFGAVAVGDLLALAGAWALALELVIIGEVTRRIGETKVFEWTALYTLFIALAFTVLAFGFESMIFLPAPKDWNGPQFFLQRPVGFCALAFTAIAATAIANYLANWATSQKDSNKVPVINAMHRAIMENLDAPLSLIFALLFFPWNGVKFGWSWLGFFFIVLGVMTSELALVSRICRRPKAEN